MRMSLATQRIIGSETGVANTIDPLGGSFFIERLTNDIEEAAMAYIKTISDLGDGSMLDGMFAAIDSGYIEKEIAQASYDYQSRIEAKDYLVLGLNDPIEDPGLPPDLYEHDEEEETRQIERFNNVIKARDTSVASRAIDALRSAAEVNQNLMPYVIDAARAHVSEGEIMGTLREVFGEYTDPAIF